MPELCKEKHKQVDMRLDKTESILCNHAERIDRMEVSAGKLEERLAGLITQLGQLNTTMRWFIGVLVTAFVGFFFYVIQGLVG